MGLSGLGQAGKLRLCPQGLHIQPSETLPVSWVEARHKLPPGSWTRRRPTWPVDKGLHISALPLGQQEPGKQKTHSQSLLSFFGCFSNLQDNFFPRLIDQSQGARILKRPVAQGMNTAAPWPQMAPFLLPPEAILCFGVERA